MKEKVKLLSQAGPWDLVATGYEKVGGKFFGTYADHALSLVTLNEESHVLDVACGPGTLAIRAASQVQSVRAVDFSQSMLRILEEKARNKKINNLDWACEDGQDLPFSGDSFDAAFSLFGLMFFPDRKKGLREIHRTLKKKGKVVISSWAPLSHSTGMQAVFGALRAINRLMPDPVEDLESLENPDFFKDELEQSGFGDVEIHPVIQETDYRGPDDYWDQMVRGNAPLAMMKEKLPQKEWEEKSAIALNYLVDTYGSNELTFSVKAWFAIGTKG